jgi:signal peptidase I
MAEEKRDPALETEETAVQPEDASPKKEKEPETLEGTLYCWTQALVTAVVSVVLLFTFGVRLISVNGPSMQNTLYTGDELLILNSMFCAFKAGDVVVYNAEEPLNETLVKRIVAVGGQTVDVDPVSGTVTVDGQELDEPYIKEPTYTTAGTQFPLTLAEDEVFVMGDNRNHSSDSRDVRLGAVNVGYLQGKVLLLLIPGRTPDTNRADWSRVGTLR